MVNSNYNGWCMEDVWSDKCGQSGGRGPSLRRAGMIPLKLEMW
jgi:hypothetical protein